MKQFEKWQKKFAEAKNGFDLMYTKNLMESEMDKWCHKQDDEYNCGKRFCEECMTEWGNSEVKEDDNA